MGFVLTLWLGWGAIIAVVALSVIAAIYLYVNEKRNTKKSIAGTCVFFSFALSVFGTFIVVICMLLKSCVNNDGPSYERIERRTKIHTSEGDKMPTMDERGEYHNAGTGERQIEYGGSIEQQRDIKAAEKLIEDGY